LEVIVLLEPSGKLSAAMSNKPILWYGKFEAASPLDRGGPSGSQGRILHALASNKHAVPDEEGGFAQKAWMDEWLACAALLARAQAT
jgi:hypothetical protein